MPLKKKSSINGGDEIVTPTPTPTTPTPLRRRSKRLLLLRTPTTSTKMQVFTSPISSSSSLKSRISISVQNASCKKPHQDSMKNLEKSSNNGSGKLTGKMNGAVGGFRVCRRSPRLSVIGNTPQIIDKNDSARNVSNRSTRKIDGLEGFQGCRGSLTRLSVMESRAKISAKKIDGVEGFQGLRRSPRFSITDYTPEIVDKKNCVKMSHGLIVSTRKIDGVKGFQGCRQSPRFSSMKSTVELSEEKNLVKTGNGSTKSTRKIYGVEGLQACRRSPPFPIMEKTPEVFDKKNLVKSSNMSKKSNKEIIRVEGFQGSKRSPSFPIMDNTHEISDKETCVDSIDCMEIENPFEGTQKRKSLKRGRQSLEVMDSREITGQPDVGATVPNKGKEKKKKGNVSSETNGNWDRSDYEQCKENGILQDVRKKTLPHLRTPLSSIENVPPEKTQSVRHGKLLKKLVESKIGVNKSVKSLSGPMKKVDERQRSKQCGVQGWTKDQELALQRAYFAAKPSPNFWKKISKMVPGRSAQDCFDKVQSSSITPPQPQPRYRSRANRTNSSPLCHLSLSGSKLLEPAKLNVKQSRGNKRTKCLAHKTVRHLLQKQNLVNQGYTTDLFSILEPTVSSFTQVTPETTALSTPKCLPDRQDFIDNCHQRSLSANKQPLSRFRHSSQASLVSPSPAVLKKIRDMAFYEKYIDQLHCREAKRTTGGRRCVSSKEDKKEGVQKTDVIKAAKNALASDARDMIKKFQNMQANAMDTIEDSDVDDSSGGDDGEG